MYRMILQDLETGEEDLWLVTNEEVIKLRQRFRVVYGPSTKAQLRRVETTFPDNTGVTIEYNNERDDSVDNPRGIERRINEDLGHD